MPFLDITPEMLGADRTNFLLAYIQSWMLFPDDGEKRRRYLNIVHIESVRTTIRRGAAEFGTDTPLEITAGELLQLFDDMRSSRPLPDMQQDVDAAYLHGYSAGCIAGLVLLSSTADGERPGLQIAKKRTVAHVRSRGCRGLPRISPRTIENTIWPRYRVVAHFWAAFLLSIEKGKQTPFPCEADSAEIFLARAEHLRKLGESYRPKQSPNSLFGPDMVKVPADIHLPSTRFAPKVFSVS